MRQASNNMMRSALRVAACTIVRAAKRAARPVTASLSLATAALIVTGCHGLPQKTDETAVWTDNKLYSEAQDSLTNRDWTKCAKYFESLQGRDPFSRYAQQAQINVAYCDWKDGETDAADQAVDRFIKLHPGHPDVAYAYYLKGMIHFNDDLGFFGRFSGQDMSERDPKSLRESYDAFKSVVDKYPDSKYAPDAAARMRYIVNALASHEVHTADYYYRRGAYIASINRAQLAIKQYKDAPAIEDALHLMILSYTRLNEPQLAEDTRRILAATFPDSPYITGRPRPGGARRNPGGRSDLDRRDSIKKPGFKAGFFFGCHTSHVRGRRHYSSCAACVRSSKKSRTASISRVRLNGGKLCQMRRPYGLSTRRVSQIISTPRSVSARMSRPAPCLSVMTAWGNWWTANGLNPFFASTSRRADSTGSSGGANGSLSMTTSESASPRTSTPSQKL